MRFSTSILLALIATVNAGCTNDGGNWYCSETDKVVFNGIGFDGSYSDVVSMNENGQCTQQTKSFSGNLSPLDEELSVHFRGPIKLLQFGVYTPSNNNAKRDEEEDCTTTQHVHHKHKRATAFAEVTHTIFVDGEGNSVTQKIPSSAVPTPVAPVAPVSPNGAQSPAAPASPNAAPSAVSPIEGAAGQGKAYRSLSTLSAPTTTSSGAKPSSTAQANGAWERVSYFTPGSADNLVFMNYYGGSGSGVWSAGLGNSLSYSNSDCSGGSANPVALGSSLVPSNNEYIIFSGEKCSGNDCGYYREGIPAYHGFGGSNKIFVFEFEMPTDNAGGLNGDMPAVWLLNAKIPRTLQYGNAQCSCWSTGCGELDLFEILAPGSDKMICHLHDGQGASGNNGGGGSADFFARPTLGSFKAAAVFVGSSIHILEVSDNFGSSLDEATVQKWINQPGSLASIGY